VTSDRFTGEEERAYELLWDAFFSENITNFTTIVRTNFPYFEDDEACKKDIKETDGRIAQIINVCRGKVVHVDNPPVINLPQRKINSNELDRKASREKLLDFFGKL